MRSCVTDPRRGLSTDQDGRRPGDDLIGQADAGALSPSSAAGNFPIGTVGRRGPTIRPPTCGVPPVTPGQVRNAVNLAAGGISARLHLIIPTRFPQGSFCAIVLALPSRRPYFAAAGILVCNIRCLLQVCLRALSCRFCDLDLVAKSR